MNDQAPTTTATTGAEPSSEMGENILNAVERITDSPDKIKALVEALRVEAGTSDTDALAERIIAHYTKRSTITGGVTALPALIPGLGTAVTLVAGPLADMVLLLKFEVEMALALAVAHGYDIARPDERQLAFLLAAVKTGELSHERNMLVDLGTTSVTAIWNYSPRRVAKMIVSVLAMLAFVWLTRGGLLRAIPLVGIAVGASMNKALTSRVGRQAHEELKLRKRLTSAAAAAH